MSDFTVHRNRRGHLIGFSICGFRIDSWDELDRAAKTLTENHPDSWSELYLDAHELKSLLEDNRKASANQLDHTDMVRLENAARQIKALEDDVETARKGNRDLIKSHTDLRLKAQERIISMKAEVKQEIKAVEQVLKAIKDGRSSHWQKKENIRLALEILATIPTFDRHDFFNYEDDF